jgi:hypothetical protein
MRQVQLIEKETLEVERTIGAERYESSSGELEFSSLHTVLIFSLRYLLIYTYLREKGKSIPN